MKTLAQSFLNNLSSHPRRYILVAALFILLCQCQYYHELAGWRRFGTSHTTAHNRFQAGIPKPPGHNYTQTLVLSHMKHEDVRWIQRELPALDTAIYAADDQSAPLHPPLNKGHESMSYLTYIIDNYDNFSDTTIFIHAHQTAWHNNNLFDFDMARMLRRLSNEHVEREGFFNLRCHPESGCPNHINLGAKVGTKQIIETDTITSASVIGHQIDEMPLPISLLSLRKLVQK